MRELHYGRNVINMALIIIDMQNGFVSKGGSYDKLGMNIENYQQIIPNIKKLINFCREEKIPIFYTEAIREPSGIDLLLNIHNILPRAREERLQNKKIPICMRGTWDADIIDEIKPAEEDHIILKRRDSAFQDTELRVWLQSLNVNTLIFCGIDTSICVETSLRDAFNLGYDVILVSDATASGNKKHYETTIERVRDYYGVVISIDDLRKMVRTLEDLGEDELQSTDEENERISQFLEKHNLINVRREKK
ncbi:Peroxyureidoacrylate/ureidoacrylate amidohydrolase RutB [Candidatus Nitrosocosmicus franklandus]|uniref:Peroxyureidoacrylate/ureidoacrylate amidohydrolase RutB n=2 Tax=Candidatus Nitrosocosmicus franklandianus TaxID=1798806 RepID=A0A484I722_9ARCH|nr:Peroxyureidoacrylate/ureidoacrylate amidohydrolase RutB [Candidatus Nitrosocosmicus franklandus]